jgi:thiamine biosynthesis protein ThiS
MRVLLNGREADLPGHAPTLQDAIEAAGVSPRGLICERNGEGVPPGAWATVGLEAGDRLEWVRLVGGG